MNEIERLLAAVPRPDPSQQLDRRVNNVLSQQRLSRLRIRKNLLAWCGTTVGVGLICFFMGRLSIQPTLGWTAIKTAPSEPRRLAKSDARSATVLNLPLRQDQLASLFLQTAAPEGLLGKGPVIVEVSALP